MDPNHLDPSSAAHYARSEEKEAPSLNSQAKRFSNSTGLLVPDRRSARKLVLCFDGTGNKFHGDDSDSNILKIFRMLDRTADDQYHYYQRESGQTIRLSRTRKLTPN